VSAKRRRLAVLAALTAACGLALGPMAGSQAAKPAADPQAAADAKAAAAAAKANAAKLAALDKAFKPIKDDAPLEPRQQALQGTADLDDENAAKSLLLALEQLRREAAAIVTEADEIVADREALLEKLAEARGRQPKADEKKKLEKWEAELKRLGERLKALQELAESIAGRIDQLRSPAALTFLLAAVAESHGLQWGLRARLAGRAVQAEPPLVDALRQMLERSTVTEERVIALEALAACGPAAAVHGKWLADFLFNEEPRIANAAIWTLAAIGSRDAIGPLVHRLGEETAILPGRRVALALRWLTGADFGVDGRLWRSWLTAAGAPLVDGSAPLPPRARNACFDLPIHAESIAFVIDASEAMLQKRPAPGGGEETRLDAAKREVLAAIGRLPPTARYTVVAYAHEPRVQSKSLLPATPESVAATAEWVGKITTVEKTVAATSEALACVLVDAAANELPEGRTNRLDAILLLTAGIPVTPDGKREPPQVMQQLVELRNKPVQALIEVVALGDPRAVAGLVELADQNAGRFVVR